MREFVASRKKETLILLVVALMTLKLWELGGLFLLLIVILIGQLVLVAAACFWPLFQLMGRDYDSAVMGGGFIGFMMGTTANAMAVMKSLVERYGRAPARLPRRPHGRGVLHRLHQCPDHHRLFEHL